MKSKSLGTTNLHYPNKQNYCNQLISQSSAFISNPATTVCSLHSSEKDQTETKLVLLHLGLKCFPCSHVLELADKVPTSPPTPFPCTLYSNRVLWGLMSPPDFAPEQSPPYLTSSFPAKYCISFCSAIVFLALGCLPWFPQAQVTHIPHVLLQQPSLPLL